MLKVLESNNQYFSKKDIDLVRLYVQETKKYPLLTREEEQKYGKHLQLYPEIMDILSVAKINNNVETVLNLDKILAEKKITYNRETFSCNGICKSIKNKWTKKRRVFRI